MPRGDLDDFDLEPTMTAEPSTETRAAVPAEADGGSRLFLLTLVAVALVAFGVLILLYVVFRQPSKPRAAEPAASAPGTATAPALPAASAAAPAPATPLPGLDESDDYVRRVAAALSSHPELARWLAQASLVRTLAVVVTNIAEGESPRPHLAFLAPTQRFRAAGARGRRIVADPAGFSGYDRFADAVGSIDATAAVSAYHALEPLFDAAYKDLGHPEGGFRRGLDRAIAALVATPAAPADAELVPHAIGFRYLDPRLEGLTAAQKQLLRIGPRNVPLVQAKLRELQSALGAGKLPPANSAR
jgi:hypothetical protein